MALDETTAIGQGARPVAGLVAPRSVRIAICLSHFHPTVGGAERQMLQLARAWHAQGHPVHVFTRRMADQPHRESVDGVAVHRSIRTVSLGPLFGLSFLASLAWSLWRSRREYDVVLAGQASWEAVAAALAAKLTGKPLVIRAASTGATGELAELSSAKGSRLWLRLLRSGQRFLASSNEARQQFLAIGCPAEHVLLAHNGVDLTKFHPGERSAADTPTAIFVGRLVEIKRPFDLLEAWRRASAGRDFRLWIVGDGPLRESLTSFVRQHQLANVEFVGQQNDVASWYRKADVFVLSSAVEGSSNSLLEAMASGLCPVVTRVGGNVDIVEEGVTGLLVEPNHVDDLAAALTRVLSDRELCRRLAAQARRRVEAEHDLVRVAEWYLRIFSELTN